MDNIQLSELAQKAKNGDMAAFEEIYTELSPDIYSIVYEITQNKEESRDLTQDCFVAAMESIKTLKEPDKIKNWLIRIAANKSHDYIKKKKPSVLTEDQSYVLKNLEDDDVSAIPDASLETDERIDDVNQMLQCLTEEKRLCLLLRYKYDMSYAEIANELGISETAVKSRISRAKDDIEKEAEKRKKKGLPLFGVAPFGLVIFALKKSTDTAAASFAGSAAQGTVFAGISAASQAGVAAATTATAATGIGAKIAAMSVAQKVVAGVAAASIAAGSTVGTAVIVKNSRNTDDITTTAFIEEITTAPNYAFENETVFISDVSETESNISDALTDGSSAVSSLRAETVSQSKTAQTTTAATNTVARSTTTTRRATTTQKRTTTTQRAATTQKAATTTRKATTTQKAATTTKKATTTQKAATTTKKATTTQKAATTTKKVTTTQKATTTRRVTTTQKPTTTKANTPATVTVKVYSAGSGSEYKNYTLTYDAGVTLTGSDIETGLMTQYGIDAMADTFSVTTQSGGSYTATAYEI